MMFTYQGLFVESVTATLVNFEEGTTRNFKVDGADLASFFDLPESTLANFAEDYDAGKSKGIENFVETFIDAVEELEENEVVDGLVFDMVKEEDYTNITLVNNS